MVGKKTPANRHTPYPSEQDARKIERNVGTDNPVRNRKLVYMNAYRKKAELKTICLWY